MLTMVRAVKVLGRFTAHAGEDEGAVEFGTCAVSLVEAFEAFSSGIVKPSVGDLAEIFSWGLLAVVGEEEEGAATTILEMTTIQVATTSITSALRIIFVLRLRVLFVSGVGSISGIVLVSDDILDSFCAAAQEGIHYSIQYSVFSITCCRRRYRYGYRYGFLYVADWIEFRR
jgi:hypothetical protein